MADENSAFEDVQELWRQLQQAETARHEHGVANLKAAIPFLRQLGVTMVTMDYNGSGDQGDIEDIEISGFENAPKTCEELDKALEGFPAETKAHERFCIEKLKDRAFELLPGGFEINEGSYGQVIIDCEKNKVRLAHNERVMEVNSSEQEW